MNTNNYTSTLAIISAIAISMTLPQYALAADSTSYRLYDALSDVSDQSPMTSNSYALDEGGGTWTDQPIVGSNFQIVSAPPPAQSSSSSSVASSESSTQPDNEIVTNTNGGHRGSRTNESEQPQSPIQKPSKPSAPSIPELPAQVIPDTPLPNVEYVPNEEIYHVVREPVSGERSEQRICAPHFFDTTDEQQTACPQVHYSAPRGRSNAVSVLMILVSFFLGYLFHYVRPGNSRNPFIKTKTKPKSKKKK